MSSYSSSEILAVLTGAGFHTVSQRGSHVKLRSEREGRTYTVILQHPVKDLPSGTFSSVLRQAGLTRAQFEALR